MMNSMEGGFFSQGMDTHRLFLYLGVVIFLMHFAINGFGMDISLFGLLLIFLGWRHIAMPSWVVVLLWILIIIEILGSIYYLKRMFDAKFGGHYDEVDNDANSDANSDVAADDDEGYDDEGYDDEGYDDEIADVTLL